MPPTAHTDPTVATTDETILLAIYTYTCITTKTNRRKYTDYPEHMSQCYIHAQEWLLALALRSIFFCAPSPARRQITAYSMARSSLGLTDFTYGLHV